MARPRNRRSPPAREGDLSKQAAAHLAAGRFRDAVHDFKQLAKQDPGGGWEVSLSASYLGRADELAAKGMVKEALTLLHTRADLQGLPPPAERCLAWLVQAGDVLGVARILARRGAEMPPGMGALAESFLAAHALVGDEALVTALGQELPPLHAQVEAARAALHGACDPHTPAEQQEAALARISLRGPCRDVRTILKGWQLLPEQPEKARDLLARVSPQSPFASLAAAVSLLTLEAADFLERLPGLSPGERAWYGALAGVDREHLQRLGRLSAEASGCGWVADVGALARDLPPAPLRTVALHLLDHHPRCLGFFEKGLFPLTAFARHRLLALAAEREEEADRAVHQWERAREALQTEGSPLVQGAILRHIAQLEGKMNHDNDAAITALQHSLTHDPDHLPAHQALLLLLQEGGRKEAWHRHLEEARRRFPSDPALLAQAVEAAMARESYKKAARLAGQLLAMDPINGSARNSLLAAHLAHGRKLVASGRLDLARKELALAAPYHPPQGDGELPLVQGLVAFMAGDPQAGQALVEQGQRLDGQGVAAALRLYAESLRLGLPDVEPARKALAKYNRKPCDQASLEAVLRIVDPILAHAPQVARVSLQPILGWLRKGAALPLTREEADNACRILYDLRFHALLKTYADSARKRWPHEPSFHFYHDFGRCEGDGERLSYGATMQLQEACDLAAQKGDFATVRRVEAFFGVPQVPFGPPPFAEEDDGELEDFLVQQMLDSLREFLGPSPRPEDLARLRKDVLEPMRREAARGKPEAILGQQAIERFLEELEKQAAAAVLPKRSKPAPSRPKPTPSQQQLELDLFE